MNSSGSSTAFNAMMLSQLSGMKISHFYRQYYVYQYATCYAAAQMLSQRILDGDDGILDT